MHLEVHKECGRCFNFTIVFAICVLIKLDSLSQLLTKVNQFGDVDVQSLDLEAHRKLSIVDFMKESDCFVYVTI